MERLRCVSGPRRRQTESKWRDYGGSADRGEGRRRVSGETAAGQLTEEKADGE